jgi:CRISPR-associated protein Csd2
MAARKLIAFKHENQLGKAPSHQLFEAVTLGHKGDKKVPREFSDYAVSIEKSKIPDGVEVLDRLSCNEVTTAG